MSYHRLVRSICSAICFCVVAASAAAGEVRAGEQAPLFKLVDESMRPIDMADFIDGAPLVFIYGSAT